MNPVDRRYIPKLPSLCDTGRAKTPNLCHAALLQAAIDAVAQELAQMIIRDAEGAHHFVQIDVTGCRTRDEAFRIAKAVADSPLVKTAICGADPNWDRVVSAAGYAGVPLQEEDISLTLRPGPPGILTRNTAPRTRAPARSRSSLSRAVGDCGP